MYQPEHQTDNKYFVYNKRNQKKNNNSEMQI